VFAWLAWRQYLQNAIAFGAVTALADFLGRFPPFQGAPAADLERVAEAARTERFDAGDVVLVEDGAPATALHVVRSGAAELVHDDDVVALLEPGELFGHPSLLSGRAPAFTVRTREPSEIVRIPAAVALPYLSAEFVAATLRQRMVRAGEVVHARGDVRTAHLGDLVHRPAAVCRPDSTVREAAEIMAEKDVSCILVDTGTGYGVLTDSDLRRKLVAEGRSYDTPVSALMVPDALTVPPDRLAVDAMIDMLDLGIHHLPVVDAQGVPVGIITATDLMYLEGRTPFAVRRAISKASSVEEVVEAANHLPQTIIALVRAGVAATDIGRVLALASDTATSRLLQLVMAAEGEPPAAWSWMALGSVARKEQSLASDQDNALAYAAAAAPGADAFFARVAEQVNSALERCGFGPDNSDVLARNRQWRMSDEEWQRVFSDCLEHPDRSHLVRAAVAFDFRHVTGGLDIVRPLASIQRKAPNHPDFIRRLARTATDFTPPLGRRGKLATARDGTIDLKKQGIVPIVNLARFHALSAGVTISPTLDRLAAAETAGQLDRETASALREAFELVMRLRIEHQAEQANRGVPPDDRLDPSSLPPLTRSQMVDAFRLVAAAQKQLARYVPLGM
jgi:CBS domain-containing protein